MKRPSLRKLITGALLTLFGLVLLMDSQTAVRLSGQTVIGPPTPDPVLSDLSALGHDYAAATQAAAQQRAADQATIAGLRQQVQAAQPVKGWLATNIPAAGYYTSNIHADICQQASGFYDVGDAPAGSMSANGYPVGNNIHMRSQNWLYDVPAGTLNVTWTGTATLALKIYGAGTWKQTGANGGTLTLPAGGPAPTTQPNNSPQPILWIDVTSSSPTDPLNNLHVWQPGYGPGTANAGLAFRADYSAILAKYAGARFMACTYAMSDPSTQPADRVQSTSYDQTSRGCSIELCCQMAKEAHLSRVWFCMPFQAGAALEQNIAQVIHDALPGVEVTIEYADEPFNSAGAFAAYHYLDSIANGSAIGKYDGTYNPAGQFIPTPAGQPWVTDGLTRIIRCAADTERTMSRNVRPIFADNPGRLKVCFSSQAGNVYWASEGLKWINAVDGTTSDFDVLIEAPYFDWWPDANTTVATGPNGSYQLSDLANGIQSDLVRYVIPQVQAHTAIARQYHLTHECYEAGASIISGPSFTGNDLGSQYGYSRMIGGDYLLYYMLLKSYGVDRCYDFDLGPGYWNQYGLWSTFQTLSAAPSDPTGPTPANFRYQAQQQIISLWN